VGENKNRGTQATDQRNNYKQRGSCLKHQSPEHYNIVSYSEA